MTEHLSVQELRRRARTTPQVVNLDLLLGVNHTRMLELIVIAIDYVSQLLSRNPELKQDHSEDELTIELISHLCCMGFNATHETKVGGHCDIKIEGDMEFLWLGEAKKFDSDYSWLIKGFQQLNTRYTTGGVAQNSGALIIYVFAARIDRILERLASKLLLEIEDLSIDTTTKAQGFITSTHSHRRTGATFTTRLKAISLLWDPD